MTSDKIFHDLDNGLDVFLDFDEQRLDLVFDYRNFLRPEESDAVRISGVNLEDVPALLSPLTASAEERRVHYVEKAVGTRDAYDLSVSVNDDVLEVGNISPRDFFRGYKTPEALFEAGRGLEFEQDMMGALSGMLEDGHYEISSDNRGEEGWYTGTLMSDDAGRLHLAEEVEGYGMSTGARIDPAPRNLSLDAYDGETVSVYGRLDTASHKRPTEEFVLSDILCYEVE